MGQRAPLTRTNSFIEISAGAMLELNFKGELRVGKLIIDGKEQAAGTYDAKNLPKLIKGTGVLKI